MQNYITRQILFSICETRQMKFLKWNRNDHNVKNVRLFNMQIGFRILTIQGYIIIYNILSDSTKCLLVFRDSSIAALKRLNIEMNRVFKVSDEYLNLIELNSIALSEMQFLCFQDRFVYKIRRSSQINVNSDIPRCEFYEFTVRFLQ